MWDIPFILGAGALFLFGAALSGASSYFHRSGGAGGGF